MKDSSSAQQSQGKPKALIVISSGKILPLSEPSGHPGISTGFFLVEMAKVLQSFGDEYDFVFATPDGQPPQLDINGMALSFHAGAGMGAATARAAVAEAVRFDVDTFRQRRPKLLARRQAELETAYKFLGKIPVSKSLPNTDKEAKLVRDDIVKAFEALPVHTYYSVRELVERNRDPQDPLKLRDFAFVHMPGGHAPMIDFVDNPYLGELLNTLHEEGALISLICHAPVAMVSAKYRVSADGAISTTSDHNFKGARLTAASKQGELIALTMAYPKVPGQKTRLTYYVDEALKEAGYQVETTINPSAVQVVFDEKANLLAGNGPQAIDDQAAKLREILDGARQQATSSAGNSPITETPEESRALAVLMS
jgi:putative intracellular protease/amidase